MNEDRIEAAAARCGFFVFGSDRADPARPAGAVEVGAGDPGRIFLAGGVWLLTARWKFHHRRIDVHVPGIALLTAREKSLGQDIDVLVPGIASLTAREKSLGQDIDVDMHWYSIARREEEVRCQWYRRPCHWY